MPFCVDISLCPSQKANDRMQQFYDITHEQGSSMAVDSDAESAKKTSGKKSTKPTPPGWNPSSKEASSRAKKDFLLFLEENEQVDSGAQTGDSKNFNWWQDVEMHRRSHRFERTRSAYRRKEVAAQKKIAEEIAAKNKA